MLAGYQVKCYFIVLRKCYDGFCEDGSIHVGKIQTILALMGLRPKASTLKDIIEEINEDGNE